MKALNSDKYYQAAKYLETIPINTLFAGAVVNHSVTGVIYVDDSTAPSTFYIAHPYGMSLLFGETTNPEFNKLLFNCLTDSNKKRVKPEWLQVFPSEWNVQLEEILGPNLIKYDPDRVNPERKVIEYTRVNFKFNKTKYNEHRKNVYLPPDHKVNTQNNYIFENMQGSVVPRYFWNDAKDFAGRAIAFSLMDQEKIISTAFSSFLADNYLEIGIETLENYRGKGYALYVCSLLIDYCIEHGLEPVWACRSDNRGSYGLAISLGFEPLLTVPYYKLVVASKKGIKDNE